MVKAWRRNSLPAKDRSRSNTSRERVFLPGPWCNPRRRGSALYLSLSLWLWGRFLRASYWVMGSRRAAGFIGTCLRTWRWSLADTRVQGAICGRSQPSEAAAGSVTHDRERLKKRLGIGTHTSASLRDEAASVASSWVTDKGDPPDSVW